MSTPISNTWAAAALGLALAGCGSGFDVTRSVPEAVRLADGLLIAGARGWCVDTSTTRTTDDAAVVVLGSCAALGGNAFAPKPAVPGVVTVSVETDAASAPPPEVLQTFLGTSAGRAALSADGTPDSVRIIETYRSGEVVFVHAENLGDTVLPGASSDYWRALFDMDGRFVSISLVGLSDEPIDRHDGLLTLSAQADRLIAANPG